MFFSLLSLVVLLVRTCPKSESLVPFLDGEG